MQQVQPAAPGASVVRQSAEAVAGACLLQMKSWQNRVAKVFSVGQPSVIIWSLREGRQ